LGWNRLRFLGITPNPRVPTMSLEDYTMSLEDYCDVDEFCRMFLPAWHRRLVG